jgi:outer membrane protein assembly factor BamB
MDTQDATPAAGSAVTRRIRWWPVSVILLLAAGALVWVWGWYGVSRQERIIATANVIFFTVLLLLLWVLLFSRARTIVRWLVFGGAVGVIGLTGTFFRIRGVTGDLVPILEWRWKSKSTLLLEKLPPTLTLPSIIASTNDYPQYLGPDRTGMLKGPVLARDWKAQPPELLWRQPIGPAWSGFAVSANLALTQEQRGEEEMVVCYDLLSGKVLWSHADNAHYLTTIAGEGPRATPTIVSNRAYALGATGILNCLELANGKSVWSKRIIQDNQSRTNDWGVSCSPLVMDQLVVISAGGKNGRSLVAYQGETGDLVWNGGDDEAGYSSPCSITLAGMRQILIFNAGGIAAHDPASGRILWDYPWPRGHPHVALPVALPDDHLLVSSGYGTGSELLKIKRGEKWSAAKIWKSIRLKSKFANLVYYDGYIYGLDDGILVCLDPANGDLKWKEGRYGHGQIILVGKLLLVMAESGDVVLLEPSPEAHRELTRFSALQGKTWNPHALAGEYLLVRNDKEAACYRLPLAK